MPANARELIAWDTMVVIDCLEKRDGRYESIRRIVKRAEDKEIMVVVSAMAVTETQRINGCLPEDEVRIIDEFFDREWIHPEGTGTAIAKIARDLCRDHKITNTDATHIATAKFTNCKVFLTNDGQGKKKKQPLLPLDRKILLADGTPLRIMTPEEYDKMITVSEAPLFEHAQQDRADEKETQDESEAGTKTEDLDTQPGLGGSGIQSPQEEASGPGLAGTREA